VANKCVLKNCPEYKICTRKKDPFKHDLICLGYYNYITQDSKSKRGKQFEFNISNSLDSINVSAEELKTIYESGKTRRQLIIQMFFFDNESVNSISEQLYCTKQYIHQVIKECKKMLLSKTIKKSKLKKQR
jgi:hypothetical protein